MAIHERGRFQSDQTIRNEIRRELHGYAGALAEKILGQALKGDGHAMLACVRLLELGLDQKPSSKDS